MIARPASRPGQVGPGWLHTIWQIRYRLLLINLLIVAVPIIGVGFARMYERELLRALEDDMIHQARVLELAMLADAQGLRLDQREPLLRRIARRTRCRFRLLDATGALRADSHRGGPPEGREPDPPELIPAEALTRRSSSYARVLSEAPDRTPSLGQRVEVQQALAGRYGSHTRLWNNGNRLYLFAALPLLRGGRVLGVVYVTRSTNPVRASLYRLRTWLIKLLLAAMAATSVLTFFLARTISGPLQQLSRAAGRVAAGERGVQLALERGDEIGELARVIDRMARKLAARAEDAAELAANISHEFKSPLTSIRGAAELLAEGAADDPQARRKFLDNILSDADRLDRLVSRLLQLSRFEADRSTPELVDLEVLVYSCLRQSRARQAELSYLARRRMVEVRPAQLRSAIVNLLDNAQAHARTGSRVLLQVADSEPGSLRCQVINQGPVIRPGTLQKIWQRFFTTRGDAGGTGLGLTIVKSVVEAHGGSVFARSSEAEGTVIGFELPCALSEHKRSGPGSAGA